MQEMERAPVREKRGLYAQNREMKPQLDESSAGETADIREMDLSIDGGGKLGPDNFLDPTRDLSQKFSAAAAPAPPKRTHTKQKTFREKRLLKEKAQKEKEARLASYAREAEKAEVPFEFEMGSDEGEDSPAPQPKNPKHRTQEAVCAQDQNVRAKKADTTTNKTHHQFLIHPIELLDSSSDTNGEVKSSGVIGAAASTTTPRPGKKLKKRRTPTPESKLPVFVAGDFVHPEPDSQPESVDEEQRHMDDLLNEFAEMGLSHLRNAAEDGAEALEVPDEDSACEEVKGEARAQPLPVVRSPTLRRKEFQP